MCGGAHAEACKVSSGVAAPLGIALVLPTQHT